MLNENVEIVEKLPNGKFIIKIENQVQNHRIDSVVKFALADKNGIINIVDLNNELLGFHFFDTYDLNESGEIIIGIKKAAKDYIENILSQFDLSDTEVKTIEVSGGPFNVGPYAKQCFDYIYPTKTVDDIVPHSYSYNFGLINQEGVLIIYPSYEYIEMGNENTCIVGILEVGDLMMGYVDTNTGKNITPICFNEANKFYDNRAVVKYHRKYGYIDRNKIIINPDNKDEYANELYPQFFRANDFNEGLAMAGVIPRSPFDQACYAEIGQTGIISIVSEKTLQLKKNK